MIDTMETDDLTRLAAGKRVRRNSRVRRALIARLVNEDSDTGDDENSDETGGGNDEDRQLVEALVGSRLLRRRRLRIAGPICNTAMSAGCSLCPAGSSEPTSHPSRPPSASCARKPVSARSSA